MKELHVSLFYCLSTEELRERNILKALRGRESPGLDRPTAPCPAPNDNKPKVVGLVSTENKNTDCVTEVN